MKTLLTAAVVSAIGLTAGQALANQYGDVATVISTTPVYQRVSAPRQECWAEQVAAYDEHRVVRPGRDDYYSQPRSGIGAGTVLGAIVGGAIGHQFGNSSGGRDHGTAAGAIIGGLIGHDAERNSDYGYRRVSREVVEVDRVPVMRDVQRCRTVSDDREEVAAYDVRYSYQGREYVTRMSYNPGPTLPVNVEVRPLSRQPAPTYRRY